MSGRLSDGQMDQLESWIGTGPKTFILLYSITRDGCVGTTFHQKCDGQGPTVTVLYNPQGSIYGGYTSDSWVSNNASLQDNKAFLFQLQFSGNKKLNKFPCTKQPQYAIYCASSCGPTFGAGHDIWTFTGTVNVSNGVFSLNGGMNGFGTSYDSLGVKAGDVNNGTMDVTELEVYKITDGQRLKAITPPKELSKPWRKVPDINEKYLGQLKEEIENIKPATDMGISEFRILMLGPMGSGKSSFYNTLNSIFRGRISHRAPCGHGGSTTAYTPYRLRAKSGSQLNFRLCDTRGMDQRAGPDITDLCFLLDGHIPDNYEFNNAVPMTAKTPGFVLRPQSQHLVHCVAFIIDASKLESVPTEVLDQVKRLRKHMNQIKLCYAVLLTNIDKVDSSLVDNPAKAFHSAKIGDVVEKVASIFGLPRNVVFPVKNYEHEVQLDDQVSALALMALQQLLYMAEDYTESLLGQDGATGSSYHAHRQTDRETTDSDVA